MGLLVSLCCIGYDLIHNYTNRVDFYLVRHTISIIVLYWIWLDAQLYQSSGRRSNPLGPFLFIEAGRFVSLCCIGYDWMHNYTNRRVQPVPTLLFILFCICLIIKRDIWDNIIKRDIWDNITKRDIRDNITKRDIRDNIIKRDIWDNIIKRYNASEKKYWKLFFLKSN